MQTWYDTGKFKDEVTHPHNDAIYNDYTIHKRRHHKVMHESDAGRHDSIHILLPVIHKYCEKNGQMDVHIILASLSKRRVPCNLWPTKLVNRAWANHRTSTRPRGVKLAEEGAANKPLVSTRRAGVQGLPLHTRTSTRPCVLKLAAEGAVTEALVRTRAAGAQGLALHERMFLLVYL